MAALGMDAVAAIRGYRSEIIAEAARRGLRMISGPLTDPLDIRLTVDGGSHPDLDGRVLRWSPAEGWSSCLQQVVRYYAGPGARPLDLVPAVPHVLDWAVAGSRGRASRYHASPPDGVDLDDDPTAIRRLIDFVDPYRRRHAHKAFRTPHRHGGHHVALVP